MADSTAFREQFLKDYMDSREGCKGILSLAIDARDSVASQKFVALFDSTLIRI